MNHGCDGMPSGRKFSCPLTNTIMEEPVSVPCCDVNYERVALLSWMRKHGNRCPQSGEPLLPSDLKPNARLQWEILYLERTNSDLNASAENTSPAPPSNVDSPPLHPRSPREGCTRKSLSGKTDPVYRKSCDDTALDVASSLLKSRPLPKVDCPPLHPRSPREGCVRKSLNGKIDPAPLKTCNDTVLDSSSGAKQGMACYMATPSSSPISPPSKVDCPPLHPRSPQVARKSLSGKSDPIRLKAGNDTTLDVVSTKLKTMAPFVATSPTSLLPSKCTDLDTSQCSPTPSDRPTQSIPQVSSCKVVHNTGALFCIQSPGDTTPPAMPIDTTPPAPTVTRRKRTDRPPTNPRSPPVSSGTNKLSELTGKRMDFAPALPQRCHSVVPASMNTVLFPSYTTDREFDACLRDISSSPAKSLTTILDQVCSVLRMGE